MKKIITMLVFMAVMLCSESLYRINNDPKDSGNFYVYFARITSNISQETSFYFLNQAASKIISIRKKIDTTYSHMLFNLKGVEDKQDLHNANKNHFQLSRVSTWNLQSCTIC